MAYKVWPFMPQHGVDEVLEWKTDVLRARDGEQRISLRAAPRQHLSYTYSMNEATSSKARALAYGWGGGQFGIPVWTESEYVGYIGSSATTLPVDTTLADYAAGDRVLVWQTEDYYADGVIDSLTSSQITLTTPIGTTFNNAWVCPLRLGKMADGFVVERGANPYSAGSVEFRVDDNLPYAASPSFPVFQGLEVLTDVMYYLGGADERVIREVEVMDNLTGKVSTPVRYSKTDQTFYVGFSLQTRAEKKRIRAWLHSVKGRLTPFWLASQAKDLTLTADAGAAATSIQVSTIGYAANYGVTAIRIHRTSGVVTYHRVNSGTTAGSTDTLTLSASIGVAASVADTESISFMRCVRLDSDRVEISHQENHFASIKIPCIEVPVP